MTDNKSDCTPWAEGGLIRLWVKVCEHIQTVSPTQKYFTADTGSVLKTTFKMSFWNSHNKSGSLLHSLSISKVLWRWLICPSLSLLHTVCTTLAEHAFNCQLQAVAKAVLQSGFSLSSINIKDVTVRRAASPFRNGMSRLIHGPRVGLRLPYLYILIDLCAAGWTPPLRNSSDQMWFLDLPVSCNLAKCGAPISSFPDIRSNKRFSAVTARWQLKGESVFLI